MPGAAEFQAPSSALRSPRASVPRFERPGSDIVQSQALTVVTSQPMTVDCMSVCDGLETSGAGYCVVSASMPMASQPQLAAMSASPGAGPQSGGGVVYWMPVVTVPYANNMGQVNLGWSPSQDPYGKDLPLSDMNTLRYFFNLGVEYFRISANMQQQAQQVPQPQTTYLATSPMPQLIPGGGPTPYMAIDHGGSFVTPTDPPPRLAHSSGPTNGHPRPTSTSSASSTSRKHGKGGGSGGGAQEAKSDSCEMSSDVSDSGCNSCGEGGQSAAGDDDPDTQMELASNRTDEDSGSTQGEEAGSEKGGMKTKAKRKYYMYGNHKLIKPIKDIPPRFAMLLAENSAAKARCEGPPIYIPMSHAEMMSLEQQQQQAADPSSGLNADAQCFYPTHGYDTMMMDENGTLTSMPPPMMVPPPSMLQQSATSGQNPANVVYSCLPPSSASAALPPPPVPAAFSRSLSSASNASSRSGDGSLLSFLPANQGKGQASSGPEGKRPEELARSSSSHKACSDVVASVSPLSVAAPPFPSPTSMPPSLASPLHATGHAPSPNLGGGKQCFYVYPSHSAGYPGAMQATPPQPQSHAHGALSQGQVVYVMNPQGYGPIPPCTTYQPTYMAPPAHTMGMPCPPVAVQ